METTPANPSAAFNTTAHTPSAALKGAYISFISSHFDASREALGRINYCPTAYLLLVTGYELNIALQLLTCRLAHTHYSVDFLNQLVERADLAMGCLHEVQEFLVAVLETDGITAADISTESHPLATAVILNRPLPYSQQPRTFADTVRTATGNAV